MKFIYALWTIILAQSYASAQVTLHALEDPGVLHAPSPASDATESTFIKAIGIGSDGFTTYEEVHIPETTAPSPTSTSGGGFNVGGINATKVDTFAEAASGYKTQASWTSAGIVYHESLTCDSLSGDSANCVDVYEISEPTENSTLTTTFTGHFKPIFAATTTPATSITATSTTATPTATSKSSALSSCTAHSIPIQLSVLVTALLIDII